MFAVCNAAYKLFLHGCKTKAGVGRTGNEAIHKLHNSDITLIIYLYSAMYIAAEWCIEATY